MHNTVNVLDKVPLSVQATMKKDLREVYWAPNRASAEVAIDVFAEIFLSGDHPAVCSSNSPMPTTGCQDHQLLKSKIQKGKKARSNTPLSCKIEYFIETTFA